MYLSKSAYGGKQAALNHWFHLHNRLGFPVAFKHQLLNLFQAFFHTIMQCHMQGRCHGGGQHQPNHDNPPVGVAPCHPGNGSMAGKEPMSVELYHSSCKLVFVLEYHGWSVCTCFSCTHLELNVLFSEYIIHLNE